MNAERQIKTEKRVGAGGRLRSVSICEMGCSHGSYAQAMRCKSALALVARDGYRDADGRLR